jgi:hypothetical protein
MFGNNDGHACRRPSVTASSTTFPGRLRPLRSGGRRFSENVAQLLGRGVPSPEITFDAFCGVFLDRHGATVAKWTRETIEERRRRGASASTLDAPSLSRLRGRLDQPRQLADAGLVPGPRRARHCQARPVPPTPYVRHGGPRRRRLDFRASPPHGNEPDHDRPDLRPPRPRLRGLDPRQLGGEGASFWRFSGVERRGRGGSVKPRFRTGSGLAGNGSDGTRTRDLRRDRPEQRRKQRTRGEESGLPCGIARRSLPAWHFELHGGARGYHVSMSTLKAWIERRRWHQEPRSQGRLRAPDAPPDHEEPPARPLRAYLPSSSR